MKILLVGVILAALLQSTFKVSYTGYVRRWTDVVEENPKNTWPVHILWKESKDSSLAEMQSIQFGRPRNDTIIFSHLSKDHWKLVRWNRDTSPIQPLGDARIEQTADSIKISMGFGFSGVSYYARRDSV